MKILDLLRNIRKGGNVQNTCSFCKSLIGDKYKNEYYMLNSKVYCSTGCFSDDIRKGPEKNLATKKKKGKKK